MNQPQPIVQPSGTAKIIGFIGVALILGVFVAWVAFYLLVLRPMLLNYLMSAMGVSSIRFPAMLHLIPAIGAPVLLVVALTKIFKLKKLPEQRQSET